MANPTTRAELKEYCLRKLGKPVIEINVDDTQLEDRIDEALLKYKNHHFDASVDKYVSYKLTQTDIDNEYIPLDDSILYIIGSVLPISGLGTDNKYTQLGQIKLSAVAALTAGGGLASYYLTQMQINEMQQLFNAQKPFDHSRHEGRLYIQMDWAKTVAPDDYIVFEANIALDPTTVTRIYNDEWLKLYTTALFKEQWGENLSKFGGITIMGNIELNGSEIKQEAKEEIEKLEEKLRLEYSLPTEFFLF